MTPLQIVFMGTAGFAVPSLKELAAGPHRLSCIVTGPDQPKGRGQKVSFTPVKQCAVDLALPVLQPENLKDPSFAQQVRELNPDLIVVVAFRILPPTVFEIPRLGSINLHASLLPKYRGAAPINWALMNGETESGVTTFFLKPRVDTGEMLLQQRMAIEPEDNAGTMHDKLAILGAHVLLETVNRIAQGRIDAIVQDDSAATPAPKIHKETCIIDWTCPARVVHNKIRGLSPYPAAFTTLHSNPIKIFRSALSGRPTDSLPGAIVELENEGIGVACGNGQILWIRELQPASKKRMSSAEYLRGYDLKEGERFL